MEFKYEIYTCNNGNPTAIIRNRDNEKTHENIAEKIYEIHPDVDQVAVILDTEKEKCTFQLVNGEFCGNACLSVSAYMYENYKIQNTTIINKIKNQAKQYLIEDGVLVLQYDGYTNIYKYNEL